MKQFCENLRAFNKVHRLIGNVSCETLITEALQSIQNSEAALSEYSVMVDVGAGSGVLGYAWLLSKPSHRLILVEPDRKALSFLINAFAEETRALVLGERLENLRLSRLSDFERDPAKIFLATRAFSSNHPLKYLYEQSELKLPLFSFEKVESKHYLVKKF